MSPKSPDGYSIPNYSGNGILNLITSIGETCGAANLHYAPLAGVDTSEWKRARNLVLLLIDGLGADFLERHSPSGFLRRHQVSVLTSVCPTTTATAIPTIMTGLAPAAHAMTGWHVYVEELDAITAMLPITGRGVPLLGCSEAIPERLYGHGTFFQQLQRPSRVVTPVHLSDSEFSRFHTSGATRHPYYRNPYPFLEAMPFFFRRQDMFGIARRLCHEPGPANFMYAYWPFFDSCAHELGIDDHVTLEHFASLETELEEFLYSVRGTDTLVLVTADHGMVDSHHSRQIHLNEHRTLAEFLIRPLSGERRFAYCYVRSDARVDFESYIADSFGGHILAWPREKLMDEQWFGPGPVSPRLHGRVGDYVLAMKDDWTILDHVPGEHQMRLVGVHGGLSAAEMHVPLCVTKQA